MHIADLAYQAAGSMQGPMNIPKLSGNVAGHVCVSALKL